MKAKHTSTPWNLMFGMPTNVLGFNGMRVARCDFDGDFNSIEAVENARLIVEAVNAHAESVAPAKLSTPAYICSEDGGASPDPCRHTNSQLSTKWISVENLLPPRAVEVLTVLTYCPIRGHEPTAIFMLASWMGEGWVDDDGEAMRPPTHWAALPDPPEEK